MTFSPTLKAASTKETYRSEETIEKEALPDRFEGARHHSTGIYYLLENPHFSAFHRIKSDEMWHFHTGSLLIIYVIHPDGRYEEIHLGAEIQKGQQFQAVVPAGSWFASQVAAPNAFALVGCTVSPGFDFADFEMAKRAELTTAYPDLEAIIKKFTRS